MQIITKVRTVLPRLTKARFSGFGIEKDEKASNWGWASLYEISPIIRCHYAQQQMGEWPDFGLGENMVNDIFGRYGSLNGVKDSKPLITWASFGSALPQLIIDGDRPTHPPVDPHQIYVPMLWAKNVIAVAEAGICRVTSILRDSKVPHGPNNDRFNNHQLIGYRKEGNQLEMTPNGCGSYWYTPFIQ